MISRQRGIDDYRSEDTAKPVIDVTVTTVDLEIVSLLSFDQIAQIDNTLHKIGHMLCLGITTTVNIPF